MLGRVLGRTLRLDDHLSVGVDLWDDARASIGVEFRRRRRRSDGSLWASDGYGLGDDSDGFGRRHDVLRDGAVVDGVDIMGQDGEAWMGDKSWGGLLDLGRRVREGGSDDGVYPRGAELHDTRSGVHHVLGRCWRRRGTHLHVGDGSAVLSTTYSLHCS